jgi:hypothetical protein
MTDTEAAGLPAAVAAASRKAAEDLYRALDPHMTAAGTPAREITALWQTAKMLAAVSGGVELDDDVPAGELRARWEEAAANAEDITDAALTVVADGMTPVQAAAYLADHDSDEVWCSVNLQPWYTRATGSQLPPLVVTADRGPAPEPRPHTASTVLRAGHALATAAAVLGELVLELPGDGIPFFIGPHKEITCEVCGRTATAETYRRVETGSHGRTADVCSVPGRPRRREPRVAPALSPSGGLADVRAAL